MCAELVIALGREGKVLAKPRDESRYPHTAAMAAKLEAEQGKADVSVRPSHLDLTRLNKDACVHKFSMDTCTQLLSLQTRARRTNASGAAIPTISKRV